jgi:small subunit ribosomal protein S17
MSTVENTETTSPQRGERKVRQGYVVSDKMDKTVVVARRAAHHPPAVPQDRHAHEKYHAHDETNDVKVGDLVRIVETRPCRRRSAGACSR